MLKETFPLSEDMSDAALAALAADGSDEAFDLLADRLMPMMNRLAMRYRGVPGLEAEDLLQEGLLGLVAAVHAYRAQVGSFSAFAAACVRNRVVSVVRKHLPAGDFELSDAENALLGIPDAGQADPEQLLIEREEAGRLYRRLREKLTPLEYTVLCAHLAGKCYKEIAALASVSEKAVDNALQRARRKLSKDGL